MMVAIKTEKESEFPFWRKLDITVKLGKKKGVP